jgi:hypothetical protein
MRRSVYPYCPAGRAGISPVARDVPVPASWSSGAPGVSTGRRADAEEAGLARAVSAGAVNGPQG